jgi:amino acid adenylation domain-containing protein
VQSYAGAVKGFELEPEAVEGLKRVAISEQATMFMALHAVFALVLWRHSGSGDIVIGTPVANRMQKELEGLVGFFVNTLVLRTRCGAGETFREYLRRVRGVNLEAQANQDVPFEMLVERLRPQRSRSHEPLFQILMSMNTNERGEVGLTGVRMRPVRGERVAVKYEVALDVMEEGGSVRCSLSYNSDLFDEETIERLGEHFKRLARAAAADPEREVGRLPVLSEAEREQLLYGLNDTGAEYGRDKCLQELIEQQVERSPDAVAVVYEGSEVSYGELNRRGNQLGHYLRKQGVGPEVRAGICMERSVEMVVGILGILKAGGAYVPLDPSYPQERLQFMVEDAQAAVLLTEKKLAQRLSNSQAGLICLDEHVAEIASTSDRAVNSGVTPQNLAYVIYTSGSTGRPKGVAIEHRSANVLMHWGREVFSDDELQGILASTSICFDLSVFELFVPLSWGGRVVVAGNALSLPQWKESEHVKLVNTVPSAMGELLRMKGVPSSVRVVNLAGEALHRSLVQQIYEQTMVERVLNLYGPSEDTTYSTYVWLKRDEVSESVSIGRPVANTQAYVLDDGYQPVPMQVTGELYLGGAGLSRGYLNRPELTAEKFIPDAFRQECGGRIYRTGDQARWRADGQLDFLGRIDDQVKVRGFRIELGEIETRLRTNSGVQDAAVVMREDEVGDKRLVAYIVATSKPPEDMARLRAYLQQKLPDYMVPAQFVVLDELPLTPNGKLDRKALPAPDDTLLVGEYIAPNTSTEAALQDIWQAILQIPSPSVTANFFELGGHSILATRLVARVNNHFGNILELQHIFQMQTIRGMASYLDAHQHLKDKKKTSRRPNLLELKPGEWSEKPLFLIHPVGGYAHCYSELAINLDYHGPVFGLQVDGPVPETIEAMAKQYIEAIKLVQPKGSYLLGGWSMGGVVAYEMAQRLSSPQENVDLLLMFDSFCPDINAEDDPRSMSAADKMALLQAMASELGITDQGLSLSEKEALDKMALDELLAIFLRLGKEQNRLPLDFGLQELSERYDVTLKNSMALRAYRALPLDIEIHLIRAEANKNADRSLGWGSVATKVSVSEQSGDHFSMMHRPHVSDLAKTVSALMQSQAMRALRAI